MTGSCNTLGENSQQAVGAFVDPALPGTEWVAEAHGDSGCHREAGVWKLTPSALDFSLSITKSDSKCSSRSTCPKILKL